MTDRKPGDIGWAPRGEGVLGMHRFAASTPSRYEFNPEFIASFKTQAGVRLTLRNHLESLFKDVTFHKDWNKELPHRQRDINNHLRMIGNYFGLNQAVDLLNGRFEREQAERVFLYLALENALWEFILRKFEQTDSVLKHQREHGQIDKGPLDVLFQQVQSGLKLIARCLEAEENTIGKGMFTAKKEFLSEVNREWKEARNLGLDLAGSWA